MAQPSGLFAQIGANGGFAFGRTVAFVEEQVQHLVHDVEPADEFAGRRRVEISVLQVGARKIGVRQVGALESRALQIGGTTSGGV